MLTLGQKVRVTGVFAESFPGVHTITDIVTAGDGSTAYILGEAGGFDAIYLEVAA